VLIKRFSETRRLHPLVKGETEAESIFESISEERRLLSEVRGMADVVIDTSDMRPMELKVRISEIFAGYPLASRCLLMCFPSGTSTGRHRC